MTLQFVSVSETGSALPGRSTGDGPAQFGSPAGPVAYLINQYPKVSHAFIRREILALERAGIAVKRFALRGWDAEVVDETDAAERAETHYVLRDGVPALALAAGRTLLGSPRRFASAVALALRMSRGAERPWPYHLIYLAEACRMLGWLRDCGARHLHAHFGTNSAEVAMLVHALGGPSYSFTVHGPEEFDRPQSHRLQEKIERAEFVVAVSSYGRSQLFRWAHLDDWPKVKVVHCGVDRAFHADAAVASCSAARILCVGRLCEQKGQLLLVQAVARIVREGLAVELVLAGDGEMRAAIETLIDSLALREHVRITGWISSRQVREEIVAARAVALPSFAEGLPVVLMEAMLLRRPVISTYVAGIPELVRDGQNGWLVPAGDVDALAQALASCLRASPQALDELGAAARARALERHDADTEAAKLARLFEHADASPLGRSARSPR